MNRLKLKAQILCGDETALGPGKADLLEAIDREGSISAAARAMGMSYRRAWLLVDAMNRCWASRLVDTAPGGGSRPTPLGREILALYRAIETRIGQATATEAAALIAHLREAPLPRAREADQADRPVAGALARR